MDEDFPLYLSDEPVTSREEDGRVRIQEKDVRERLKKTVSITLDGIHIPNFPETQIARDERGLKRYRGGIPFYRFSTIYDVARFLVYKKIWSEDELQRRIPVLCHRDYLDPVGVCRMCSVNIEAGRSARKLSPACQHRVGDGYVVHTRGEVDENGKPTKIAQEIDKSLKVITSLLIGDHRSPNPNRDNLYKNELQGIADFLGVEKSPFPCKSPDSLGRNLDLHPSSRPIPFLQELGLKDHSNSSAVSKSKSASKKMLSVSESPLPYSSRSISVDHDLCILCDRCVRACTDIKKFSIIGHTGKGKKTRISFDLDNLMNDSSCKQCGECMTQCPTGALVLERRVHPRTWPEMEDRHEDPTVDLPEVFIHADEFELLHLLFDADEFDKVDNNTSRLESFLNHLMKQIKSSAFSEQNWKCSPEQRLSLIALKFPEPLLRRAQDIIRRFSFYKINTFIKHFAGLDIHQVKKVSGLFRGIPYPYLLWNEGAIRLRKLKKGELLCKEGVFGSTAFLLLQGKFEIRFGFQKTLHSGRGFLGSILPFLSNKKELHEGEIISDADADRYLGQLPNNPTEREKRLRPCDDLILGEMACLTSKPRTASLRMAEDGIILEVTRNILDMIQRSPAARPILDEKYKERALETCLRSGGDLFRELTPTQQEGVKKFFFSQENPDLKVKIRRVARGEVLLKQGAIKGDFFIIRYGFVKVLRELDRTGTERILTYLQAGQYFGEIAILSESFDEVRRLLPESEVGRRTATCIALDDVELLVIPAETFINLCKLSPAELDELAGIGYSNASREPLVRFIAKRIDTLIQQNLRQERFEEQFRSQFIEQGLYQGQKLLVLDLNSCTRCDECTRACADSHDGHARLLREGNRFGDFLVATSCRSCHKPYCMEGCPVDAIHRVKESLEIRIENHCIGCGLCERQCPYGSIHMVPTQGEPQMLGQTHRMVAQVQRRAVNCDLCTDLISPGREPFCVAACPHEAAFRWTGEELLANVSLRAKQEIN